MKYKMGIEIKLKSGHSDPEGETTARLLRELGYKVTSVNVSKMYRVVLESRSRREAQVESEEMCKRLLSNPTKDDFVILAEEGR
jgi:phosphoribosylformylglycinamidine synthase PurS subunit